MKNVIITILAILVLGLGGYLVYDKVIDKDVKEEVKEEVNEQESKEYTLIDPNNASIQFLFSIRAIDSMSEIDETLYTTEFLKAEDRTQEDKYRIAALIFGEDVYDNGINKVVRNEDVKTAYERIFGPNTYSRPTTMIGSASCISYTYDSTNDYFIQTSECGGAWTYKAEEEINEVRKYNDRIEIKTSYCFGSHTVDEDSSYYSDTESKNLIAKISPNNNINIFEEYKDKMNHMTYTYKLGEDGFYYYYSSQMDK